MKAQPNTVLKQLGHLIEQISDLHTSEEIYDCIARLVPQILPADHVAVTNYLAEENAFEFLSVFSPAAPQIGLSKGQRLPSYSSYEEYAASIACPNIYSPGDNLDQEFNSILHSSGIISVMVAPLIHGSKYIGTIRVASKTHEYAQEDVDRIEIISALLTSSISHTEALRVNRLVVRHRLYAKHLEHLNALSEELLGAESTNEALQLCATCAMLLVDAGRVSFCELNSDQEHVTIVGLIGKSEDSSGTRVSLKDSGLEDTLIYGKKKYTTNLLKSSIRAQRSLGMAGYKHIWSFPIQSLDQSRKCLNISSTENQLQVEDAMSVLDTLARLLNSTFERIAAQEETFLQAKTDPLTGLCNRTEFNEQLNVAIETSKSVDDTCIMYLDLDLFKDVNDTMGHLVGDNVLIQISKRLRKSFLPCDTLARIGGDEFMVLLRQLSDRPLVESIAEQLILTIGQPLKINSSEFSMGASIGICRYPEHGATPDELIKNADIAMYKAKDSGRNQFYVFSSELSRETSQRIQLQNDLLTAIRDNELSLVFQPQFDIKTLELRGVEALLRWNHRTMGWIPPDEFIPIAENCGLISSVSDWVLKNSLEQLKKLHIRYPSIRLAVNISAVEFSPQQNLLPRIISAINQSGVEPRMLEIELTETAFMKHPEHACALAEELRATGINIALDDFGTGYASLTYLVELPISCIKIDRSFVDGVDRDEKKQAVIRGILAISDGLNIPSLGEGVETEEQLDWLKNAGCHSAQGYLLSKPVSAADLPDVIENLNVLKNRAA